MGAALRFPALGWLLVAFADLADWAETNLLNWLYDTSTTPTRPTSTTVHLHTGDPGEAGTANEVDTADWTNYAAVTVNNDGATSPFWTGEPKENSAELDYGTATVPGADVVVSHISVQDQAGNVTHKGALGATLTVTDGLPVTLPAGELKLGLD